MESILKEFEKFIDLEIQCLMKKYAHGRGPALDRELSLSITREANRIIDSQKGVIDETTLERNLQKIITRKLSF